MYQGGVGGWFWDRELSNFLLKTISNHNQIVFTLTYQIHQHILLFSAEFLVLVKRISISCKTRRPQCYWVYFSVTQTVLSIAHLIPTKFNQTAVRSLNEHKQKTEECKNNNNENGMILSGGRSSSSHSVSFVATRAAQY